MGTTLMALAVTVQAYFSHLMFAKHLALFYMYSKQQFKADIMINKWMLLVAYLSIYTSTHVPKKKKGSWYRTELPSGPGFGISLLSCVPLLTVSDGDSVYKLFFSENRMTGKGKRKGMVTVLRPYFCWISKERYLNMQLDKLREKKWKREKEGGASEDLRRGSWKNDTKQCVEPTPTFTAFPSLPFSCPPLIENNVQEKMPND